MASTVLSALLGVSFWALATHMYSARVLGLDGALVSAMMTISMVCQLNLSNVIFRFLPQVQRGIGRRVLEAYGVAGALSLLTGIAFILLAPSINPRFTFLDTHVLLAAVFAISIVAWSVFSLEEAVLASLGFATWLPVENCLFSIVKIALLPVALLFAAGHGVFISWVLPLFVSVPVINVLIARRVIPHASRAQRGAQGIIGVFGRRRLLAFLAQDLLGTTAGKVSVAAVPMLVVAQLGAAQNAYFYIPFVLVTSFDLLSLAVVAALTTEAARTPARVRELTRIAITRFLVIQVPLVAVVILAAPLLLRPFGAQYVHHGTTLLRLLIGASCFRSAIFLYCALARLSGHGRGVLLAQGAIAVVLIGSSSLLAARMGLVGIGVAWLSTFALVALLLLPGLVRFLRNPYLPGMLGAAPRAARAS